MMATHKLLIATYFFPPAAAAGSFRLLGFTRHLPKLDWQTIVVAPPEVAFEPADPGLGDQVPPETIVIPVPEPRGLVWKPVRMALGPYSAWVVKAMAACSRALRDHRPDAVLTSGPPHLVHRVGLFLKRRYGLPWVADFRDPWITREKGTPICGIKEGDNSIRMKWLARLERAMIENADAVVTTGPLATRKLVESFPSRRSRIVTLTNGYDPERFDRGEAPSPAGDRLTIVHAGEIYAGRDPRPLLDAIRDLESGPDRGSRSVRVRFVGREPDGFDFAAEVRQRGLEANVEHTGQVSYQEALREMSRADIALLLDSPGRRVGVPAKIYEYIGAGRPILALGESDGDLAWVLRESGLPHRIAPAKDPAAIRRALAELTREVEDGGVVPADAPGVRAFTREAITRRLASILESLTAPAEAEPVPDAEDLACPTLGAST
jgi:glycosyltransferase involved in cell wall biosynthesis